MNAHKGFTLIELLVVMAILGVLAAATVIVINPVELLAQSRDAERISDIDALNRSLALYQTQSPGNMPGSTSTVYISVPDTSTSCADLGLPTLPSGWSYGCSSNPKASDGNGWVPVNFTGLASNSISALPIDPINSTSTGLYYTYTPSSTAFELTSLLESRKYRSKEAANPSTQYFPGLFAEGTSLSSSPMYNPSGLIGYWNMDEGSGTVANDLSGNNNTGTLSGSTKPSWTTGEVGSALSFDGSTSYVSLPVSPMLDGSTLATVSAWVNPGSGYTSNYRAVFYISSGSGSNNFILQTNAGNGEVRFYINGSGLCQASGYAPTANQWTFLAATLSSSGMSIYFNGVLVKTCLGTATISDGGIPKNIGRYEGGSQNFLGTIDDVRLYKRALSSAEVMALYNSER